MYSCLPNHVVAPSQGAANGYPLAYEAASTNPVPGRSNTHNLPPGWGMAGVLPFQAAQQNGAYNHHFGYQIPNQQQAKGVQGSEHQNPTWPAISMKDSYPGANPSGHPGGVPLFVSQGNGQQPGTRPAGTGQHLQNEQPINSPLQPGQGGNGLPQYGLYQADQGYPGQAANNVAEGSPEFQPLSKKQRLLGPSGPGSSHGAGPQGMPDFPGDFRQQMGGMPSISGHTDRGGGVGGRPTGMSRDGVGSPTRTSWQPGMTNPPGRPHYNMYSNSLPPERATGAMGGPNGRASSAALPPIIELPVQDPNTRRMAPSHLMASPAKPEGPSRVPTQGGTSLFVNHPAVPQHAPHENLTSSQSAHLFTKQPSRSAVQTGMGQAWHASNPTGRQAGPSRPSAPVRAQAPREMPVAKSYSFQPFEVVWAKFPSSPWWPAQVQPPTAEGQQIKRKPDDIFVVYFGDASFGWLAPKAVEPFMSSYHVRAKNKLVEKALDAAWAILGHATPKASRPTGVPQLPPGFSPGVPCVPYEGSATSDRP